VVEVPEDATVLRSRSTEAAVVGELTGGEVGPVAGQDAALGGTGGTDAVTVAGHAARGSRVGRHGGPPPGPLRQARELADLGRSGRGVPTVEGVGAGQVGRDRLPVPGETARRGPVDRGEGVPTVEDEPDRG